MSDSMMPVSEHLEAVCSLERQVADLEAELSALRNAHEQLRNDRWWATYNAALAGCHAFSADGQQFTVVGAHKAASAAADMAHGELKRKGAA